MPDQGAGYGVQPAGEPIPEPTKERVYQRLAMARYYWGQRVAEQQTDYTLYALEEPVNVPDGFNIVYPPTANVICIVAADHIAGEGPQVEVPVASESLSAEERSERVEKSVQAAFSRFFQSSASNQIRVGIINMAWAGMAVSQGPIYLAGAWGDEPVRSDFESADEFKQADERYQTKKRTTWPFFWRMVDPRYTFPDPGTVGREWVILNYRRSVGDVKAQWPEWSGKLPHPAAQGNPSPGPASAPISGQLGGGTGVGIYAAGGTSGFYSDTDLVEWIEYWDREWRCYIAAGEVLDVKKHRYGKPPFQIRDAGLGNISQLPHERFRSLLYPARSFLRAEIAAHCQLDAIMRNQAWSQMVTPIGSNFEKIMPGTVVKMQPEHIELTRPVSTLDVRVVEASINELRVIKSGVQDATFPNVVSGQVPPGSPSSGYGYNSLVAQARIRFGTLAKQMESLLSEFVEDFLRCIEDVVGESVPIWGPSNRGFVSEVIDPDDIRGYYFNVVRLNPKLPTDRANEIAIGQALLQLSAIDMDTFLQDFAGYQQPEELRIKRMRDRILESPQVQAVLRLATMDQLKITEWAASLAAKLGLPADVLMQQIMVSPDQQGQNGGVKPPMMSGQGPQMFPTQQAEPTPGGPSDILRGLGPQDVAQQAGAAAAYPGGAGFGRAVRG